jgi:hypothetical protein
LVALALVSQGCAVFVRGTTQDVTIRTTAPDAKIEVDGVLQQTTVDVAPNTSAAVTSAVVKLDRGLFHYVRIVAPGYFPLEATLRPATNEDWLLAEEWLMWPVLWLPMAIDLNSGALNDLKDPVELEPMKTPTVEAQAAGATRVVVRTAEVEREESRYYRTARGNLDDGF